MWATYNVPMSAPAGAITIGLLQQIGSGVPYAAIGTVNPTSFMTNPGYLTPPAQLEYFFLGRDPFRTETTYRTDLSVNYGYRLGPAERRASLSCSSTASCSTCSISSSSVAAERTCSATAASPI